MERLSLHQLAAITAQPGELIEIAAKLGCPTVTLFAQHSTNSNAPYVATVEAARALRSQAEDLGVAIYSLEVFALGPDGITDALRTGLEVGGTLGAKRLTVVIGDDDLNRAQDTLAAFVPLANAHGISPHVEFHAFGKINTYPALCDFLSGVDVPVAISADVLHFYRNEGGLGSMAQPCSVPIGHAQLCDGPLERAREEWLHEAVRDRKVPGEGAFDLVGFLQALPRDVRIDVEVPTDPGRFPGATNLERCEAVLTAARRILNEAEVA
ncbi:MAG: TIM barrel protein [Pseudomonadota bacterium]|nr:TIM barrel protein [Pseudomonadota bacterium]